MLPINQRTMEKERDKPAKLLSPGHVLRVFRSAGKAVRAGS